MHVRCYFADEPKGHEPIAMSENAAVQEATHSIERRSSEGPSAACSPNLVTLVAIPAAAGAPATLAEAFWHSVLDVVEGEAVVHPKVPVSLTKGLTA